jgi:hypothetical protein
LIELSTSGDFAPGSRRLHRARRTHAGERGRERVPPALLRGSYAIRVVTAPADGDREIFCGSIH